MKNLDRIIQNASFSMTLVILQTVGASEKYGWILFPLPFGFGKLYDGIRAHLLWNFCFW